MEKLKTRALIDLEALKSNYRILDNYIKSSSPECKTVCVVKADAYGHGAELCIPALIAAGAEHFAVSCAEEALQACKILEAAGKSADVLILGPVNPEYVKELSKGNVIFTVSSLDGARTLQSAAKAQSTALRVAIKLDTGMNRLGISANDAELAIAEIEKIASFENIIIDSVFTHFACADEEDLSMTREQFERFTAVCDKIKQDHPSIMLHCCNSAAALRCTPMHLDFVRLGIILYGLEPSDGITLDGIRPVMSLYSTVTHVHELKKGECVSYGATYRAEKDMTVATVGIGYGDGFIRACGKDGYLLINGKRAKILGRICMDQCIVDVSDGDVRAGDTAVIFDPDGQNIKALAKAADTINYELVCLISQRVKRIAK